MAEQQEHVEAARQPVARVGSRLVGGLVLLMGLTLLLVWLFPLSWQDQQWPVRQVQGQDRHGLVAIELLSQESPQPIAVPAAEVRSGLDGKLIWTQPGMGTLLSRVSLAAVLFVAALIALALVVNAWRSWLLLRRAGLPTGIVTCLRVAWVSCCAAQVLPAGTLSSDLVRVALLRPKAASSHADGAIASSVAVDRMVGVLAMAGLPLLASLWLVAHGDLRPLMLLAGGICLGCIGVLLVLRRPTQGTGPVGALRQRWRDFRHASRRSLGATTTGIVLALALVNRVLSALACLVVLRALGQDQIGLAGVIVAVGLAGLTSLIPLSLPGNWGTGDITLVALLAVFGVSAESALLASALPRLLNLVVSLAGLPACLSLLKRRSAVPIAVEEAITQPLEAVLHSPERSKDHVSTYAP